MYGMKGNIMFHGWVGESFVLDSVHKARVGDAGICVVWGVKALSDGANSGAYR